MLGENSDTKSESYILHELLLTVITKLPNTNPINNQVLTRSGKIHITTPGQLVPLWSWLVTGISNKMEGLI